MRWIRDVTGRFPQRPYYAREELDERCEALVRQFLAARHGAVAFPLSTDDLTLLVEGEAEALDLYADLAEDGAEVHGRTDFLPGRRPRVYIARELSEQPWREHRLRSTLAHELGHILFHTVLVSLPWPQPLFAEGGPGLLQRCQRATIVGGPRTDWLEWQAGYAAGALLMPVGEVRRLAASLVHEQGLVAPLFVESAAGQQLIGVLQAAFDVSAEAARVRLLQLGSLTEEPLPPPLFPAPLLD